MTRYLMVLTVALTACVGEIPGDDATDSTTEPGAGTTSNPPAGAVAGPGATQNPAAAPAACAAGFLRGVAKPGVRRLSKDELLATLSDIWPGAASIKADLDQYSDLVDMNDVTKFDPFYSEGQALQWALITHRIAVTMKPADVGGTCLAQPTVTEACWRDFFTRFGRKVYRRPLSASEITVLMGIVSAAPAPDAYYRAVSALFRSPDFLFHIESGVSDDGVRVRLTDHEIANRISYAVIGSLPDVALAAAADRGELQTSNQVEAHVRRLMETPRAHDNLNKMFLEWLYLSSVTRPQDNALARAKLGIATGPLPVEADFRAEIMDYVTQVVWKDKGTMRDLMTRKIAFPRTETMRKVYGAPSVVDKLGPPVDVPENAGLALRAGLLSTDAKETSPILRGAFVRRRILCDELPLPDAAIVNMRLDQVGQLDPVAQPTYEIATQVTSPPACNGCHSIINPLGFALEGFDVFGQRRQDQPVWDATGKTVVKRHALPYPVSGVNIEDGLPTTYNAPGELAEALGRSQKVAGCFATYAFRHLDRRKEDQPDSCTIAETTRALGSGATVMDLLVRSISNEDIFWRGLR